MSNREGKWWAEETEEREERVKIKLKKKATRKVSVHRAIIWSHKICQWCSFCLVRLSFFCNEIVSTIVASAQHILLAERMNLLLLRFCSVHSAQYIVTQSMPFYGRRKWNFHSISVVMHHSHCWMACINFVCGAWYAAI